VRQPSGYRFEANPSELKFSSESFSPENPSRTTFMSHPSCSRRPSPTENPTRNFHPSLSAAGWWGTDS
jgi:hypothetical protein